MNNTIFATLVHILTLLEKYPEHWLNSDSISDSIGINPVIMRKELSVLHKMGWVKSKKGKEGGSKLQISSSNISMADIYKVVQNFNVLGKKNTCDQVKCPIGKDINFELQKLFQESDEILLEFLKAKSLKNFADQFE